MYYYILTFCLCWCTIIDSKGHDKHPLQRTLKIEKDFTPIKKSIEIIMHSGVPYEFRTTVVREFHSVSDIEEIAKIGMAAAQVTMESPGAVNKAISKAEIERRF